MLRETFGVAVVSRNDELPLSGEDEQVGRAAIAIEQMQKALRRQDWLSADDVGRAIGSANGRRNAHAAGDIDVYAGGKAIQAKTDGQKRYLDAIFSHDLTFCLGPA